MLWLWTAATRNVAYNIVDLLICYSISKASLIPCFPLLVIKQQCTAISRPGCGLLATWREMMQSPHDQSSNERNWCKMLGRVHQNRYRINKKEDPSPHPSWPEMKFWRRTNLIWIAQPPANRIAPDAPYIFQCMFLPPRWNSSWHAKRTSRVFLHRHRRVWESCDTTTYKEEKGGQREKRLVVASVQPFVNRKKKQEISIRKTCRNMRDKDWMWRTINHLS